MRKHQQEQILELLSTLEEAQSAGLFADCQDVALQIGEFIENTEGEDTKTVTLLEDYCDLLYKASIDEIGIKPLKKHLIKLRNCVLSELKPNRIEVAFFPYNMSMSDSLESIYLAAKADPQCDAYWVPIPYYDKLPGGSFGQMHYEGVRYPEYIEVTDWRQYDVESRRPDAVFIMNPYDELNYVTSVHPDYYAKRLREFTKMLVYVPYFVTSGGVAEHFVTTPGVLFSDITIVQSETVRRSYTSVLERWENKTGNKALFGNAENRILALGSPKFDKVMYSKREDYPLPAEWQSLIRQKKVVFFNTTVSTILAQNEAFLDKLQEVLSMFKSRDDVVLWWRPHPLSAATFESMRPQLAKRYNAIVEQYRNEGWGIYDDTEEFHRAIVCCDAYYGHNSSAVELFRSTGKPLMLILDDTCGQSGLDELYLFGVSQELRHFYCCRAYSNLFFKIDFSNMAVDVFSISDNLNYLFEYGSIICTDSRQYFVPSSADNIAIYDEDTGEKEYIYPEQHKIPHGCAMFSSAYLYENSIYFSPSSYPHLIKLNTADNSLEYFNLFSILRERFPQVHSDRLHTVFGHSCFDGRKIVIPILDVNAIISFDVISEKIELIELSCRDFGNHFALFDNDDLLLLSADASELIRYSNEETVWRNSGTHFKNVQVRTAVFFQGRVLVSTMQKLPLSIDTTTGVFDIAHDINELVGDDIVSGFMTHGNTIAFSTYRGRMFYYELSEAKWHSLTVRIPDRQLLEIKKNIYETLVNGKNTKNTCIAERDYYSLSDFLDSVAARPVDLDKRAENAGTVGEKILSTIKELLK